MRFIRRKTIAIICVLSLLMGLIAVMPAQPASADTASSIPIQLVFNVNYDVDYAAGDGPEEDGKFDLTKGLKASLDLEKGFQTLQFSISQLREQLGEGAVLESLALIPEGAVFDPDQWAVINGWPSEVNTLWMKNISIGDIPVYTSEVQKDFAFKNFTVPMNEDWDELMDSPLYAFNTPGINGVRSGEGGVNDSDAIKFAISGGAGTSWMVYKEPIDLSGMADEDVFSISIDVGLELNEPWAPPALQLEAPAVPAPTYEVGPGKQFESIGEVPWASLEAGDVVYIYWRDTPYKEKFAVFGQGTAEQPIIVHGVLGPEGQLPQIDGNLATTSENLRIPGQNRSLVKIGSSSQAATHVTIQNLEVFNANIDNYYIDPNNGREVQYKKNAAGIWVERGEHITIRNCIIHNNGNGLFVTSYSTMDHWSGIDPLESEVNFVSKDLHIVGNYIYGNGVRNSIFEHNTYVAAADTVYEFNHYGPLLEGARGYGLKDRGTGTVVRYNWIEGGRRQISLDDAEDTALLVFQPRYHDVYVYGNVLVERDHLFKVYGDDEILNYGGDSYNTPDKIGTLYFYNNTVVTYRENRIYGPDAFKPGRQERTVLFYIVSEDQTIDARNNIFYAGGDNPAPITIMNEMGVANISHNWFSEGWDRCFNCEAPRLNDDGTNLSGKDPGFIDASLGVQNYNLKPGSPLVNAASPLPAPMFALDDITVQYVPHQTFAPREKSGAVDIGALEYVVNVESILSLIALYQDSGDLKNPLIVQLTNSLKQAEHHLSKGSINQAVKSLQNFIRHLNNEGMQSRVSAEAKQELIKYATILMNQ